MRLETLFDLYLKNETTPENFEEYLQRLGQCSSREVLTEVSRIFGSDKSLTKKSPNSEKISTTKTNKLFRLLMKLNEYDRFHEICREASAVEASKSREKEIQGFLENQKEISSSVLNVAKGFFMKAKYELSDETWAEVQSGLTQLLQNAVRKEY